MEWQDILTELVRFVEQAAPMVWAIARRQVLVYAIQDVVLTVLSGVAAALLGKGGAAMLVKHKEYERKRDEASRYVPFKDYDVSAGFLYAGMSVAIVLTVIWGLGAIGRFINPNYYAIELLLRFAQ